VRARATPSGLSQLVRSAISGLWPCVEELVLPKSVESGKLSLNKIVIRSMSVKIRHFS
jgi:hypothetical protein